MRHALTLLVLLAICGCQSPMGRTVPISGGTAMSPSATIKSQSGYIYVADGKAGALVVYRAGYASVPLRVVPLDGAPFAVATCDDGNVYVTEQLASEVEAFDSGAVHHIGNLLGVNAPDGVACAKNKVYVTNHPVNDKSTGYVSVYANSSMEEASVIPNAAGVAPLGVAVDNSGDVWEVVIRGGSVGGLVIEYPPGTSGDNFNQFKFLNGLAIRGGIAMDGHGNVIVGDEGHLTTLLAPTFWRFRVQTVPGAGILGFFTHNSMGTFIPLNDGDGKSSVIVYPESGAQPYYVLRSGMETPQGAAGGV